MSGLMSVTGTPESAPLRVGPPIVDYVAGLYAAFAVMAQSRIATSKRWNAPVRPRAARPALAMMSSVISGYLNAGRSAT
jgi:CoA:oxalate CoA-transferase